MENQYEIMLSDDIKELIIREGEALKVQEPLKLKINGCINSVSTFLKGRITELVIEACHILVDKEKRIITLITDETNYYSGSVSGSLTLDPDFLNFGINTMKKWDLRALSDFIKMNRSFFTRKEEAMDLVKQLREFKGKVEKEIEKKSDQRGNAKILYQQTVDSNIPEGFDLNIPVFKGCEKKKIKIEVNIIARDADMECYLESVEAADLIRLETEKIFEKEMYQILLYAPAIVIINI